MSISLLTDSSATAPVIRVFSDIYSLIDFLSEKSAPRDITIQVFKDALYFDIDDLGEFCIDDIATAYQAIYLLSICYNITIC